ncbi:MAG: chorismate synthase [Bacteroidia bacterium]|nr:chorismate synthase [Bacteroidia bacterium]
MSNTFGTLYKITSFGESHGEGIGVVIDGCPAGVELDLEFIQSELDRRKPGTSRITTQRKESDTFKLLSGHVGNVTTGTPLGFFVPNENVRSADYDHLSFAFRPSHSDYTYLAKYGTRDHKGGGRSSARETIARVIGGAVAKQVLNQLAEVKIEAWVQSIHQLKYEGEPDTIKLETDFQKAVRCPDAEMAEKMYQFVDQIRKEGDSVGGVIKCRLRGIPPGVGEPIYNKLSSQLSAAMISINAVKGFEFGSGFAGTELRGSEHNDVFYTENNRVKTRTNFSGGIQGGISNGQDIYFRVAFKPTSTIMQDQQSINSEGEEITLKGKGRHDPCVVPRAVPIVESMAAMVVLDQWMLRESSRLEKLKSDESSFRLPNK